MEDELVAELREELGWQSSCVPDYCDFIVRLSRYHDFSISTRQLTQNYPFDEFTFQLKYILQFLLPNLSYDLKINLTSKEGYELAIMILFFRKIHKHNRFSNSHNLIEYIRTLPNLKILFPELMGKFETNKKEFIGFSKEIYEILLAELGINIKRGNAVVKNYTPLKDLDS